MKTHYVILFFLLISFFVDAQERFFTIGVNSTKINNKAFNSVIERFNQSPTIQSMWFDTWDHLDGWVFQADFRGDHNMTAMGWHGRNKTKTAETYDTNGVFWSKSIKQRYNYFYVNFFWHMVDAKRFKMGPGIGGGLGTYKIQSKTEKNELESDFYDVMRVHPLLINLVFNVSVYLGEYVSLNIQPYLQLPFSSGSFNMVYFDNDLNPTYSPRVSKDQLLDNGITSGFSLSLSFGGD